MSLLKKASKKDDSGCVLAPVSGILLSIEKVPDKVFSTKMMGDGFAIQPDSNKIVAPVSGTIISLPESLHAFGMETPDGKQVLVHIGLETVRLNGKGFHALKKEGAKVNAGDAVLTYDTLFMEKEQMNMITIVVFIEGFDSQQVKLKNEGMRVKSGDIILQM